MRINRLNYIFANIFFLCALFPFTSPIPLMSDTQPTIIFPAILLLWSYFFYQKAKTNLVEIIFLIMAIYSFFYINFDSVEFILKKRIGLLFSFVVFFVAFRFYHLFSFKVFKYAVIINCSLIIFHYFDPQSFNMMFSFLVRKIKMVYMGAPRGASGLAPEPGFAGAVCVFYLCLLMYFNENIKIKKIDNYFLVILTIISIFLTKSGTGYSYLTIFSILWFIKNRKIKYIIPAVGVIFIVLTVKGENRGAHIFNIIFNDPMYLLMQDSYVAHRTYSLHVGMLSMLENPLGAGAGMFSNEAKYFHQKYKIEENYTQALSRYYYGSVSSMGRYLVENGMVFLTFLIIVYSSFRFNLLNITLRSVSLLYLMASLSIAFPPLWVLLAITDKKKCIKKFWLPVPAERLAAA